MIKRIKESRIILVRQGRRAIGCDWELAMRQAKGVPVLKCREIFPRRNEARIGGCDENRELRQELPTQWMQAVERGKARNRRLGRVRELADVGLFSAVLRITES